MNALAAELEGIGQPAWIYPAGATAERGFPGPQAQRKIGRFNFEVPDTRLRGDV